MKIFGWTILFILLLTGGAMSAEKPGGKIVVMVGDLELSKGMSAELKPTLSERVRSVLVKSGRYTVTDPEVTKKAIKQQAQQMKMADCYKEECLAEVGKALGAKEMITGRVTKVEEGFYTIDLKHFDIKTFTTINAVSEGCTCKLKELFGGVASAAARLIGVEPSPEVSVEAVQAGEPEAPQAQLPAGRGALLIETTPPGATVMLDGVNKGATAQGKPLIVSRLLPGAHKLRAEHPDYEPAEQDVEVAPDVQGKVEIALTPRPGMLTVNASPVKGTVAIDGKEAGETPKTMGLQAGEHVVRVTAKGYKSQEKKVVIQARRSHTISFALEKGPSEPEVGKEVVLEGTKGGPMVLIPAGEFMMGCNEAVDNQCENDEKPYHKVSLNAYYMDKHDVTVAEYRECVQAGGCKEPGTWKYCNWQKTDRGSHPINCVDWNQATAYCQWAGKRLPTEAEWEKAARGTDGRKYPWGNDTASCQYAVMTEGGDGCGRNATWPVCSKPQGNSPYGLCDMAGNVWEWVSDWYGEDYYSESPANNPNGPSSGRSRVLRGGSWSLNPQYLRASDRIGLAPLNRFSYGGFRCVRQSSE